MVTVWATAKVPGAGEKVGVAAGGLMVYCPTLCGLWLKLEAVAMA